MYEKKIKILLSTTNKNLWENDIPTSLIRNIILTLPNCKVKEINRHDKTMISMFESYYGENVRTCNYAKIILFPLKYINYYEVIQIECYRNSKYPEILKVNIGEWGKMKMIELKDGDKRYINDIRFEIDYVTCRYGRTPYWLNNYWIQLSSLVLI